MILEQPVFNYLNLRVKNKDTGVWTEVLADAITVTCQRGGTLGVAGITSVDVGNLAVTLKNVLDPAIIPFLEPQMELQLYNKLSATPEIGSIFLGTIDDISTEYRLINNDEIVTLVSIYASDAVQAHANSTVPGVKTTAGFHSWEERIAYLDTFAKTELIIPDAEATTLVYSI